MAALRYDFANSQSAWDDVMRLIVRVYSNSGYISNERVEKRSDEILDLLAHPSTKTFTTHIDDSLIGSISIFEDNEDEVPLSQIFNDEIKAIRKNGKTFIEIGQFAVDKQLIAQKQQAYGKSGLDKEVSLSLMKFALHYGMRSKIDLVCITINPKHLAFYNYLGFIAIGDVRAYPSVDEAPAVFMTMDLNELQSRDKEGLNMVLAEIFNRPPQEQILKQALSNQSQLLPA